MASMNNNDPQTTGDILKMLDELAGNEYGGDKLSEIFDMPADVDIIDADLNKSNGGAPPDDQQANHENDSVGEDFDKRDGNITAINSKYMIEDDLAPAPPTDPKAPISKEEKNEIAAALGLVTQLGVSMFACLFLGVIAGRALDNWLNTSPLFLIILILLGAVAAFKVLYDLIIKRWLK